VHDSQDAVTSLFLFHELPLKVRRIVFRECARVLKPGGRLVLVDSLQRGDRPDYAEWEWYARVRHGVLQGTHESPPVRGYSQRAGKSSFARDCVVVTRTACHIEPISGP
jgi:ubiquinone/menaquinone biosynthesis C-methylase UbiE